METIRQNKLVIFGAGKIGRSFIAHLFSAGGYDVVFIDINKTVIDALNQRHQYKIVIKSDKDEALFVKNVRGVYAGDEQKVINEISTAGILAVSVGANALEQIFPILAKGLLRRYETDH